MDKSDTCKGFGIALTGALVLSIDTLFLRLVDSPPLNVAFWRGALMFITGTLIYLVSRKFFREAPIVYSVKGNSVSLLYGGASIFFTFGAISTGIANLLIILSTTPFWAAIASRIFLKERLCARTIKSCLVAFVGMLFIFAGDIGSLHVGDLYALLAALCMAAAFTFTRVCSENLILAPCVGGGFSALILFFPMIATGQLVVNNAIFMFIEGSLIMPVALGLLALAPQYIRADKVSLFLLLETALGPLWAYLILGESVSIHTFLGGTIVVFALLVITFPLEEKSLSN